MNSLAALLTGSALRTDLKEDIDTASEVELLKSQLPQVGFPSSCSGGLVQICTSCSKCRIKNISGFQRKSHLNFLTFPVKYTSEISTFFGIVRRLDSAMQCFW